MTSAIEKLFSSSGGQLCEPPPHNTGCFQRWGQVGIDLEYVLNIKNGFFAYEDALLVRPLDNTELPYGVGRWNEPSLWKGGYVRNLTGTLFFAEDIFGTQFCIRNGTICTFDPETANFAMMGHSLDEWAAKLLENPNLYTGYPLAQAWKATHGRLQPGTRLLPKTPFVLGGRYQIDNLYSINDVKGMSFRAAIANQIHNVPDGADIVINIEKHGS